MAAHHVKQKLRLLLMMMLLMGIQPFLMFQLFEKESAGWIAGFNFVFITVLLLFGLSTIRQSLRFSFMAGFVFLGLCLAIITGRFMEWDLAVLHKASSAFYLVWLGTLVVESYLALKNKTQVTDPGL